MVLYGSPMGDSNVHNHKRVPMLLAGHGNGAFKGNLHLKTAEGTPTANTYLTLLRRLGVKICPASETAPANWRFRRGRNDE